MIGNLYLLSNVTTERIYFKEDGISEIFWKFFVNLGAILGKHIHVSFSQFQDNDLNYTNNNLAELLKSQNCFP